MSCFVPVSPRRFHRARASRGTRPVVVAIVTALTFLAAAAILNAATAHAAWIEGGTPVSTAAYAQQYPVVTADAAGGVIVAWHDTRSGQYDIYAQRISSTGEPVWSFDGVAVAQAAGSQKFPVITTDGAGGALLAWKDDRGGNYDIRAQRLGPDGNKMWGPDGVVVCAAADVQQDVEIVDDGLGGAILVWRDFRAQGVPQLFAQRLSGAGVAQWAVNGVAIGTTKQHYSVSLLADGAHGAYVAWYDWRNGNNFDIYAQRLGPNGQPAWAAAGVAISTAAGNQMYPRLASDGQGGVFLGWYDARSGGYDIYLQRLTSGGAVASGWTAGGQAVCVAPNDQFEPVMTADGNGGVFVAWYDNRSTVGVYASRLDATGQLMSGWPANGLKLNQTPSTRPAIFPGTEGAIVAWHGTPGSTNLDVLATEVTTDGQIASGYPSDGLYLCTAPGDQTRPQGISLSNGDVVLAWSDMRSDAGDIYLTRLGANLPNLSVVNAGFGFDLPLVPRNRNDATPSQARLTPVLDGGMSTTRLNWSVALEGGNVIANWALDVSLDERPLVTVPDMGPAAPGTVIALNQGPWMIHGGRHTLTLRADPAGAVRESTEEDNTASWQFVWSPEPLATGFTAERPAPPARGSFPEPNSHGFVLHPGATAWGVAVAAPTLGQDVDLVAYDDYASSTSGFSHRVADSNGGTGRVDWVVGSGALAPSIYPAVIAGAVKGTAGPYVMTSSDAAARRGTDETEQWAGQSMPAGKLLDVYDLDLVAGRVYHVTLVRALGRAPVEFHVLPPVAGAYGPDDALATHLTADGEGVGVLTFVPPTTGRYPVAVARTTTEYLDEPIAYHFFYSTSVSGVGNDVDGAPRVMDLSAPSPNPTPAATRVTLALPEAGYADVRLFDVRGRLVTTLLDASLPAGRHEIAWNGRDAFGALVASGLYFVRSEALGVVRTQRVVVRR
jgi:hypothetical protein